MYDVAVKLFKALTGKVRQFLERNKVDVQCIGAKPVQSMEYVDVTPASSQKKNHKLIDRVSSKRVTLPKRVVDKWYKRDVKAVKIRWIRDPKDPDDVTHLLIDPVFKRDEDVD